MNYFLSAVRWRQGCKKSKFQNKNSFIQTAVLDSLRKSMIAKWFQIFKIVMLTWSKWLKTWNFVNKWASGKKSTKNWPFLPIWGTSSQNIQNLRTLCIHTFSQAIWISNQNSKTLILKFWLSYTWPRPLTPLAWAKDFEKCIFFCFTSLSMDFGIEWCTGRISISKSCGKKMSSGCKWL